MEEILGTVMTIGIDINGNVTEVKGAKDIKAKPEKIPPDKDLKVKNVNGHGVVAWQTNPQKCVTYYYPGGAWTV